MRFIWALTQRFEYWRWALEKGSGNYRGVGGDPGTFDTFILKITHLFYTKGNNVPVTCVFRDTVP